ncbi:MAG: hypothetical protein AB1451_11470 [Nitrospirota bacterium]
MSASWALNSTIFADLDLKGLVGGQGLGFHRLIAQVDVTTHSKQPGEDVAVTNIGGELRVRGRSEPEHVVGYMRRQGQEVPLATGQYTYKTNVPLEIELDARRVDAIERVRLGGDLFFSLSLFGVAHGGRDRITQPVPVTLQYRANQGTWIEILGQMGYRKTILLEIPVLEDDVNPQFPQAAEYLQTAQTHMLRGHFRDAVGACRDVMESLSTVLNDDGVQPPEAIKSWFEGTRAMGKEERLRIVRRALKILTHPARHADEVSTAIEWGPADARGAIVMAAALLNVAGERK